MNIDLERLLTNAFTSPLWRLDSFALQPMAGEADVRDWVISEAVSAGTFGNLSAELGGFLTLCDQSLKIADEMGEGTADEDVIAEMVKRGLIQETEAEGEIQIEEDE